MSTASRKYHDVVLKGNSDSSVNRPCEPAPGAVKYDVVSALACHVIGPLSPTTWKLTASFRPASSGCTGSCTNGKGAGSLQTEEPGVTVTLVFPPKDRGWFAPGMMAAPLICNPA